jgi:hypothetical protein
MTRQKVTRGRVSFAGGSWRTPLRVLRNDEVAAQSRSERDRLIFYETINAHFRP